MKKETGFLKVDGIRLEYEHLLIEPTNTVPTLVFLHEGLGCINLWRDFPEKLCKATSLNGFVYSRQGYGKSDPVGLPRPIDFMNHEALNVLEPCLDAAKLDNVILVGHSDGGSISLINAGGAPSKRITAVVTIAAHVFNEDLTIKSIEQAKIAYETTDLRKRLKKYHGRNVDCAFWGWNRVWLDPEFRNWNIENYLSNVKLPVLVLQGSEDQYGTRDQVDAIINGLAGPKKAIIIEGAMHSPHLEKQNETVEAVKTFVDKHTDL
ncbi:MAG: alpha/beta hydrolase [Pseudomonadota bacterium]|nr:alpha/beta hydrolase [Pseudomonadota bacterium]